MPERPDLLPLISVEEMEAFENITDASYEAVVEYLQFLGGRNIHECVIFCLKEAVFDTVICDYSVWGERGNRSLFNTRLIKAIYDAVSSNFQPPPHRDEFFKQVSEGVRFGKQRIRNITVGKKQQVTETEARQKKHDEATTKFVESSERKLT
ncbi:PREDICTED: uncharacterized protein LOC108769710 [Trachymyrmex cornetzi]|nr:PREDICTED: uncharacterized protein LOC108769710 [Trachymyrmex cornetzi]